jgi:hypothetical protein
MTAHRATPALIVVVMLIVAGCGGSAAASRQSRLIAYQDRIGVIDKPFARPTRDTTLAAAMLKHAITQYDALTPPAAVRGANAAVIGGLRGELRALGQATHAALTQDQAALSAADALAARSRSAVSRGLARITRYASACRADVSKC